MSDERLTTAEHTAAHGDKIKGYRRLPQSDIDEINAIKAEGERVRAMLFRLEAYGAETGGHGVDTRWLEMARKELQTGFMYAVRAVAKPDGF